jgi:hypothetical protein
MSEEMTTSTIESSENTTNDNLNEANNKETSKETVAAPKYKKYKVGSEEVSLSDEDIARDYSKWKGADQKFKEAAEARKSVEQFMKALQEDPEKVLSDKRLPLNKRKLAEQWLLEEISAELNPPDPRDEKLSEAEKRLKEYEEKEKREHEAREQAEYAKYVESRKAELSEVLAKAMEKTPLSKDPEVAGSVLREMALFMRAAREQGVEVSPDELVQHIHNQRYHQMYSLAHQFEGEQLLEFLGEEVVNRIRKADLQRIKASRTNTTTHSNDKWQTREQPAKRMDAKSLKDYVNEQLKK